MPAAAFAAEPPLGLEVFTPQRSMVDHIFEVAPSVSDAEFHGNFVPVHKDSDTLSLRQRFAQFQTNNSPLIGQTGIAIPGSLWDLEVGAGYRRRLENGHGLGFDLSVGSASDLIHSFHETAISATAHYQLPSGDKNAWVFLLAYSNNRPFADGIPFPGFAYVYHSVQYGLDAVIGLPYASLSYQPAPRWSGHASVYGPTNASADWGYQAWEPVRIFGGCAWEQQQWLRAQRPTTADRLFFDDKKWILGTQTRLFKKILLELDAAYEFDRRFYEGIRAHNGGLPEANLPSGWAFQGRLTVRL